MRNDHYFSLFFLLGAQDIRIFHEYWTFFRGSPIAVGRCFAGVSYWWLIAQIVKTVERRRLQRERFRSVNLRLSKGRDVGFDAIKDETRDEMELLNEFELLEIGTWKCLALKPYSHRMCFAHGGGMTHILPEYAWDFSVNVSIIFLFFFFFSLTDCAHICHGCATFLLSDL